MRPVIIEFSAIATAISAGVGGALLLRAKRRRAIFGPKYWTEVNRFGANMLRFSIRVKFN